MSLTVGSVSESDLLKRIFPRLMPSSSTVIGPGDDAAVLATPDGRVVISIDTLVEDLDFRLVRTNGHVTSGFDVGWKAAAQNLSDINAMGARATSLVVSLTLPETTLISWVEDLADGMTAAIEFLGAKGCGVVGGDLGRGRDLAVTVAATGALEGSDPVLRSGARPGDNIALAGTVGWAAAGLALMESAHPLGSLEQSLRACTLVQRRPRPPLQAGPEAAVAGARSMLDISDGLIRDAGRIAASSNVTVVLDEKVIEHLASPLRAAGVFLAVDPLEWVLYGGEDYGILATFPADVKLPDGFLTIGTVSEGDPVVEIGSTIASGGWDHFSG